MPSTAPIGVFDSGLGGLSVLKTLRRHLPQESFVYYGDTANAPYGVRQTEDILRLCRDAAKQLTAHGVKAMVIACNTATGVSQDALARELPIPVIGIQPALEAAQEARKQGNILAMATPATFKTKRYAELKQAHGERVIDLPCPGLMEFVERGELEGPGLERFLDDLLKGIDPDSVDVVVLGCTHYPFLKEAIVPFFPGAALIDDSPRVTAELEETLARKGLLNQKKEAGQVSLLSSGGDEAVQRMERLFNVER